MPAFYASNLSNERVMQYFLTLKIAHAFSVIILLNPIKTAIDIDVSVC